jgi:DUF1016 N-terminal domain
MYGKRLLDNLAQRLTDRLGAGFSKRNLEQCRRFYLCYREIAQTLSAQSHDPNPISHTATLLPPLLGHFSLGWSHYVTLMTLKNEAERRFYEIEASANSWGVRELQRQIASSLYERLALSRNAAEVRALAHTGQVVAKPADVLKSPYVLEFLNLPERAAYSEHEL